MNNKLSAGNNKNCEWQLNPSVGLTLSDIIDKLPEKLVNEAVAVNKKYPFKITSYYANLIDFNNIENDPIFKQVIPSICELDSQNNFNSDDPLGEEAQMVVKNLIHRYNDRALMLTTNKCAVHCRFCLRKRKWQEGNENSAIDNNNLSEICKYLKNHPEIKEILISGGDPLMLNIDDLYNILSRISEIASIEIIRIGTRTPVVLPMRIDKQLINMISQFNGVWIATHFNHPVELTDAAIVACKKFINAGIPVVNQTVLMKSINDSADTLEILFRKLTANNIKPLYLFHIDPVKGNKHFETGVNVGIEIMKTLRNRISSIATPIFAIDLPDGGGKVPLLPNYSSQNGFEAIDSRVIPYECKKKLESI